jgi:1-phosphofructokinase
MAHDALVITVTPAPAIDRTYRVGELHLGEVHRAGRATAEFAGKGVNVTEALILSGVPSLAIVPLSQRDTAQWADHAALRGSPAEGDVRVNITVLEPDGRTTKINETPASLRTEEWEALSELALSELRNNCSPWLLIAGTIPANVSGTPDALASLMIAAAATGAQIALDTSGPALLQTARAGLPDFIKPNAAELAECVERPILSIGDVIDAGHEIVRWGVSSVMVSLGPDGIVGVDGSGAIHAWTAPLEVRNTIGAGDASVAGFLAHQIAHPGDLVGAIPKAVAWGAQKVQQEGSQLQHLNSLPDVTVTDAPDRSLILMEPGRF